MSVYDEKYWQLLYDVSQLVLKIPKAIIFETASLLQIFYQKLI